ncbi:MAG: sugar transferase [Verrucomicrobiales bacterium]
MPRTPHIPEHPLPGAAAVGSTVAPTSPLAAPRRAVCQLKRLVAGMNATVWMTADFAIGFVAVYAAFWLSPFAEAALTNAEHIRPLHCALSFGLLLSTVSHILGLHDPLIQRSEWNLFVKAMLAIGIAALGMVAVSSFAYYLKVGRYILALSAVAGFAGIFISRVLTWQFTKTHQQRIALVGDARFCANAKSLFARYSKPVDLYPLEFPLGANFDLAAWSAARGIDEMVVGSDIPAPLRASLLACMDEGVRVETFPEYTERNYRCVPVDAIDHRWFIDAEIEGLHPYYALAKRATDVALALAGLLLSAPLLLLAAIAIKLDGGGPVFYSQTRVGLRNRAFQIYKLRTMRTDAEKTGAKWATKGDARVTKIGKLLRKTRIDEIPQFWNILRGDMAFIGPRPERPEFVGDLEKEIPFYRQRHLVKPGLTGWAQINYPYGASIEDAREKLRFDLYYVKHATVELDLHIIVRTIGAVMKGAR